jgi:PAS domain S-box-containing protein
MDPDHIPAESVEESREQFHSLLRLLDQAVFLVGEEGSILEASPPARGLFTADPAGLVGSSIHSLVHPDDRSRWEERFSAASDRGQVRDSFRVLNREGPPLHVESLIGPAGSGQSIVVFMDVSAHFRREEELQRRNREATALFELGRQVGSSLETGELLDAVVKNTLWILECQFAGIAMLESGGGLSWKAISGSRREEPGAEAEEKLGGFSENVLKERMPVVIDQEEPAGATPEAMREFLKEEGLTALCAIPLAHKESLFGVFVSGYRQEHQYAEDEVRFLSSLSDTAALALENARLYQATAESAAQLKSLSSRISSVQEEERGRISRELHDGIGQALTAIRLNLDLVEREVGSPGYGVQENIQAIYHLVDETLEEIRTMAFELRPTVLDNAGLAGALTIYVDRFVRQTGIPVRLECPDDLGRCDPKVEATVFRVVQESLNNVAKHSGAKSVVVEVLRGEGEITLDVSDDGCGMDPRKRPDAGPGAEGLGVLNMRERVVELGGEFEVETGEEKGTRIHARIPLR